MKKGSNAPLFHFVGPNRMRFILCTVVPAKAGTQLVTQPEGREF